MKWIVILCLTLLCSIGFASSHDPIANFYEKSLYRLEPESDLNFEKFTSIIKDYDLRSVEDTLEKIATFYPQFFENYILMYHSRSLQTSTFDNPRAILFDRSGHFVFTFNGNSQHRGFQSLEVMQFRAKERRFEFREITFSNDNSQPPHISEANPAKCLACHQSPTRKNIDPRPNWEPYNIWPGAYGSINGTLKPNAQALKNARDRGLDEEMVRKASLESVKFSHFDANIRPFHSRYKWLNSNFRAKNTTDFTEIIAAPTALRAGRLMFEIDPNLMAYLKYPLLGVIKCGKLMVHHQKFEWLKASILEIGREASASPSSSDESSHKLAIFKAIDERFAHIYPDIILRKRIPQMKLDYLAEAERQKKDFKGVNISNGLILLLEPFGVSTQDWSMDFQTDGSLAFAERFGVPGYPHKTMRMGYRAAFGNWEGDEICVEIGKKSEIAIDALFESDALNQAIQRREFEFKESNKPLINRCIQCHSKGDYSVPQIPFENEDLLKIALRERATSSHRNLLQEIEYRTSPFAQAHERMPLGATPTRRQIQDLIFYLQSLN